MTSPTLDRTFEALASPHRRAIVECLARGPMTTPELGRQFPFSKQALSRHVALLERAHLVQRTPHGRVHELRLTSDPLDAVTDWVALRRAAWEASLDRLDDVLHDDPQEEPR
ncbi:MAG: metalloregulator ArsR/SmtB family transcription factor [Ilumatobacter sp.]|uniref:ArsR/SmtB family transcription factor n=1 Tax=Ilumatobacter sp. TaxID=1967498 RepID=UPI00261E8E9B|nr:metalloregulator ArsR/SmtB family transcription factor [Ilumatobacter sp.]MDJ0769704.1 metalloregulator ArsR/SmtB family transcription factor [Ilumatobacter sp.]